MARITLIATGGVRAPTQLKLADRFHSDGHEVRCIATNGALRFLAPHLLRRPGRLFRYLPLYRPQLSHNLAYLRNRPRRAPHVDEAAWAEVIVVAPATCNSIGKLAAGITDSFPLLVVRAAGRATPVIVVPSMNTEMWYDPHFQRSVDLLNETDKYRVLSPTEGQMLGGDVGWGAQVSLDEIVAATYQAIGQIGKAVEEVFSGEWRSPAIKDGTGSESRDCVVVVDEDEHLRREIVLACAQNLPAIRVEQFPRASDALAWLRTHPVSVVVTELTFRDGVPGSDLIDHFRRLGANSGVHIIATSREARAKARAEELARLDVHFQPKPLNLRFLVGLIAGCLQGARKSDVAMTGIQLGSGDVLFREGDPGTHLYFVESGRLRVVKHVGSREVTVGTVGARSIVGEMAFLGEGVRSATVVAAEPTEVVEIDLDGVRSYLRTQPVWLRVLIQSVADHLRHLEATVLTTGSRSRVAPSRPDDAMAFDEFKERQAIVWGSGPYERIAETLTPMHDALVNRLTVRTNERWLDIATGTGGVAIRAAAAGARVTGLDLAPALIETARRLAAEHELEVDFEVGDAERLPYSDAAFEVVSSAVGVVFAADHSAAAHELTRVCCPGGRLGITAWLPEGGVGDFFRMMSPFQAPQPATTGSPFDWGRREYVSELLGDAFELDFEELDCPYTPESGEAAWKELASAYGPTKALAESLPPQRRDALHRAVVAFYEQLRSDRGVSHSRTYLLVTGSRR